MVGVEGSAARACSSDRRGGEPRLLLKDPCCEEEERCLEASFEAAEELASARGRGRVSRVQLTLFHANGRAVDSRFRVKASARFARVAGAADTAAQQRQREQAAEVIRAEAARGVRDGPALAAAVA